MNAGGTNWGSSTGFGATSGASAGGLFGNSTNTNNASGQLGTKPAAGGLFGGALALQNTSGATSSNLFGNQAASGGLFGSKPQAPTLNINSGPTGGSTGGLFGSTSSNTGGLSGNSNSNTGGLFGSTSSNTGGLFGNTSSNTGGLFGANTQNSNTGLNTNSGGVNTNAGLGSNTGGLFSNSTNAGGLFGSSNSTAPKPAGGLFGNLAATGGPTGGLFGASNTSSVFNKSSALPGTSSGGLFGNSNGNTGSTTTMNPNPYNSDTILSTINNTTASMPLSITGSLFAPQKKRNFSHVEVNSKSLHPRTSLLGKLAQTFNIFRASTDSSGDTNISRLKGLFTQLNVVKDAPHPKSNMGIKKVYKKPFNLPVDNRNVGEIRKLVIKSKPLKFHLINADKVFNAKRRRILTLSLQAGNLISSSLTDEELSENEEIEPAQQISEKVMGGESYNTDNPPAVDQDDIKTNDGYWCSPSLNELSAFSPAQLSQVDNFIVGRVGHGQIAYNYPVDLSGLFIRCQENEVPVGQTLFGNIVKIDGSVVRVYDVEGADKPGIGFELNVPATITIKAPPKKSHTKAEHIKRLQKFTGMEFVTFDPITNNWTFKVKHFSVWGLIDDSDNSDNEEDNEEMTRLRELKKKQDLNEEEASLVYSRMYENEAYNKELKRQKIGNHTTGLPGGWDYNTTTNQSGGLLTVKQQIVQQEIDRQVNLYKHDKSANALAANVSDITVDSDSSSDSGSPNNLALELYPQEAKNYDYLKQIVSLLPPNTDINDLVDEKAYEPEINEDDIFNKFGGKPTLATSSDWLLQLELSNDLDSALTPYLALPRKEQLSLRTVNDILFADFNHSSVDINQISTPIKESKDSKMLVDIPEDFDAVSMTKLVQNLLLKSSVSLRGNKFPLARLDPTLTFKELATIDAPDGDSRILQLASILFDTISLDSFKAYELVDPTNSKLVSRLMNIEKRKAFSTWLKSYNEHSVEVISNTDDPLETIFLNVCKGDLKAAAQLAIASHNTHLSVLLTLLDSNDQAVKKIAENQLSSWNETGAAQFIPVPVLKVFQILAGNFNEVTADLPYSVALGLHVYYGNPAEELAHTLESVAPRPGADNFSDLLQAFSSYAAGGVSAAVHSIQASELSEKLRWIVYEVLSLKDVSGGASNDTICQAFGKFLEGVGLWKEAIYVYSTHSIDAKVEDLLRKVVISNVRNIRGGKYDEEDYLVTVLKIPRSLVYEAIAIDKSNTKDFWGKGDALMEAELWEDAHDNITQKLGPMVVTLDDYTLKERLKSMIRSFPDEGAIIPRWNQGAGMFAKYFETMGDYESQQPVDGELLEFLLSNLALFQEDDSFTTKVAMNTMSKNIGDIALEHRHKATGLKHKITALKLGENEKRYFEARFVGVGL